LKLGKFQKRKAISPLLAEILLIAIGIIASVLLYQIFMNSSALGLQAQTVTVTSDQLYVPLGPGQASWAIVVKNSGARPIVSMKIILGAGNNAICSTSSQLMPLQGSPGSDCTPAKFASPLAPGQSTAGVINGIQIGGNQGVVSGGKYQVTISATFDDGSTTTYLTSVQATSY
jgi:hypothetical protein